VTVPLRCKDLLDIRGPPSPHPRGASGCHLLPPHRTAPHRTTAQLSRVHTRRHVFPAGKYSVPVLWDKKEKTIVNNEVGCAATGGVGVRAPGHRDAACVCIWEPVLSSAA
jgi:hypothetical protein